MRAGADPWGWTTGACPKGSRVSSVLVFWDRLWWPMLEGDALAWTRALGELETLVADLLQGLGVGRLQTLILDDGEVRRFTLTRAGLLRLWRRRGTLRDWISRRRSGSHPPG